MSLNELRAEFWIDRITRAVTALEKIGAALEERCAGSEGSSAPSSDTAARPTPSGSTSTAGPGLASDAATSAADPTAALVREIVDRHVMSSFGVVRVSTADFGFVSPTCQAHVVAAMETIALRCVTRATEEMRKELDAWRRHVPAIHYSKKGRHSVGCDSIFSSDEDYAPCSCGLSAAEKFFRAALGEKGPS